MAKKSKEGAAAHAIRTVEVPDCPAVRVKVMGGGALPAGGTTGQVLTKKSDADGDAEWKDAGGGVFIDVEELPASDIDKDKLYRTSEDVYIYQQKVLDLSTTVWYGDGPDGFIIVVDGEYLEAYNGNGDIIGEYLTSTLTAQNVNSLLNAGIIAVKDSLAESKIFGTPEFFGASELVTVEKGDYTLYHNPTARPDKYIEVGGGGIVVKRCEKKFDTPLEIRPIDANNPVSVRIPLAELGLDANYDVVGVQRVATGKSPTGLMNPGFVILVDCWAANGYLVLSLVSARTSVRTIYGLSFIAYFLKT